jgi:hypothetical protein
VIRLLGENLDDQLQSGERWIAYVRQLLMRSIASGVAPGMTCAKSCRRVMGNERWPSAWPTSVNKSLRDILLMQQR